MIQFRHILVLFLLQSGGLDRFSGTSVGTLLGSRFLLNWGGVDSLTIDGSASIVIIGYLLLESVDDLRHLIIRGAGGNSGPIRDCMLICSDGRVLTLGGLVGDKVRNLLNLLLLERLGWGNGRFVSNLRDLA